ncbi:MAG: RHS repeat-associated core domain-containing protein [Bryobacterales bacterium]|nr:RHS repeat-associated core domain-containing protein [Bryobacterales bacterium]
MTAGSTTVSYNRYDAMGRVKKHTQTTDSVEYPFLYDYNPAGLNTSIRYPSGRQVTTAYDAAGRASGVSSGTTNYVSGAGYAPHGALSQSLSGGQYETRTYNWRLQPVGLTLGATAGSTGGLGLTLDYGGSENNGNLLSQQIVGSGLAQTLVQSYRYDSSNRLSKATETLGTAAGAEVWHRTFAADDYGNGYTSETSASLPTDSFTPTTASWFNEKNQLKNLVLPATPDPNGTGNLIAIGGYQLTYDGENRLATSKLGTVTTTYDYDGDGRRVKKGAVTYVYDAFGSLAAEYGGATVTSGTQYLTADWLGSTRAVSAGGTVTERRDYLPYGEVIPSTRGGRTALWAASVGVRQEFAGKERDSETGLDYFGARYFAGAQGRFTSPDPPLLDQHVEDPQSWNLYTYARNNPLVYVDPTGNAIGLTGDEAERRKQLQALQGAVGAKAGDYLYPNKITKTNDDGSTSTSYFVGVLDGGPSGEGPAFESLNASSSDLNGVIQDSQVAQVSLMNAGEAFTYFSPTGRMAALDSNTAGMTSPFNQPAPIKIWVLDPSSSSYSNLPGSSMSDGRPGSRSLMTTLIHELGHAAWQMDKKAGRAVPNDPYGNGRALQFENNVRKRMGGSIRKIH